MARDKIDSLTAREQEILRQLGVTTDLKAVPQQDVQYYNDAKRRRRTQGHKRSRPTRWTDLPTEVKQVIAKNMSLVDLHKARLVGLGLTQRAAPKAGWHDAFSAEFTARIALMEPLRKCWLAGSKRAILSTRQAYTPFDFASQVTALCAPNAAYNVVDKDTGKVYEGVCEMTGLRSLKVERPLGPCFREVKNDLLPDGLDRCTKLTVVKMSWACQEYVQGVVLRLKGLRQLHLDGNCELKVLPEDIGLRLPKLGLINLTGCASLKRLPHSLLATLERNSRARKPKPSGQGALLMPLMVTERTLGTDYLEIVINEREFPTLAGLWRKKYDKEGRIIEVDEDENE